MAQVLTGYPGGAHLVPLGGTPRGAGTTLLERTGILNTQRKRQKMREERDALLEDRIRRCVSDSEELRKAPCRGGRGGINVLASPREGGEW